MLTAVPGDGSGREEGKDGSPSLIDELVALVRAGAVFRDGVVAERREPAVA